MRFCVRFQAVKAPIFGGRRLSEYGSVAYSVERPTQETQAEQCSDTVFRGTTPILERKAPRIQGQIKIVDVGAHEFRELWFSWEVLKGTCPKGTLEFY